MGWPQFLAWAATQGFKNIKLLRQAYDSFKKFPGKDAILKKVLIKNCDLSKANFLNTNLEKADLRGSLNYIIDPERNKVFGAKFSLSEISGLLDKYGIQIDARS